MSKNKFLYFLGFTILIVIMAFFSTIKDKDSNLFSERGKVFLENLTNEINSLHKISITGRDLNMTLIKKIINLLTPQDILSKKVYGKALLQVYHYLESKKRRPISLKDSRN